jgi:D-amino-acid oxidase
VTQKIAIVGAGVIGLTTGLRLLENNFAVTIFARDLTSNMTSRAAPAIWAPYKAAPTELILKWSKQSLDTYRLLDVRAGVELVDCTELHNMSCEKPLWTQIITNYRALSAAELPATYIKGYAAKLYRIDSSIFVDYLAAEFKKLGGKIFQQTFSSLSAVDEQFKIVVNCSGIDASTLVPDPDVFPIRGAFVLTDKPAGLKKITFAMLDEENYILIVPRTNDCYIGGITQYHNWDTTIDPTLVGEMVKRAAHLEPLIKDVKIHHAGIGLRPGRRIVRLEAEKMQKRTVIHNYGHGGAGFTTAWGCATEVVNLVLSQQ